MFVQKDFELPGSHVSRTDQEQVGLRQLRGQLGKKQHALAGVVKSKLPSKWSWWTRAGFQEHVHVHAHT